MAITWGDGLAILSEEGDEIAKPLKLRFIRWVAEGILSAGAKAALHQSSLGNPAVPTWTSITPFLDWTDESLRGVHLIYGVRVETLDCGLIFIYME